MSKLSEALEEKISELQDEKEELEDSLSRVDTKIEAFEEMLVEELGGSAFKKRKAKIASTNPKKRGRPRKKKGADPDVQAEYEASLKSLPEGQATTPEQAAAAVQRYNPTPRPEANYGGVKHGTKKQVLEAPKEPRGGVNISVGDEGDE